MKTIAAALLFITACATGPLVAVAPPDLEPTGPVTPRCMINGPANVILCSAIISSDMAGWEKGRCMEVLSTESFKELPCLADGASDGGTFTMVTNCDFCEAMRVP